jgi:Fe-coproporphyrin III synthase
VHPLRRCNLSCLHCYSSSGPEVSEALPLELLTAAIGDAAAEGYNTLAVSGGEPLLYPGISELIACAHEHGMTASATTNGTLSDGRRLEAIRELDLLAVSIDGPPASHDRMRGRGSFDRMARRLDAVRAAGIPLGFIFTLTMQNLPELEWVARFALEHGARLLQIHPLELAGRGRRMRSERPDEEELQWAVIEAARVQASVGAGLVLHVDALPVRRLRPVCEAPDSLPFSFLVAPLVIESDGALVPIEHGFDRRWSLGSLQESSLAASVRGFRDEKLRAFREGILAGAASEAREGGARFVSWHEALSSRARAYASGAQSSSPAHCTPAR